MNIYICIYIYILFPISAKVLESFSLRFTELSKCNRHPPTSYKRGECVCVCVCTGSAMFGCVRENILGCSTGGSITATSFSSCGAVDPTWGPSADFNARHLQWPLGADHSRYCSTGNHCNVFCIFCIYGSTRCCSIMCCGAAPICEPHFAHSDVTSENGPFQSLLCEQVEEYACAFDNGPSCAACVSLKLHRAEANLGANRLMRQLLANGNRLDLI